ncbi:MAG: ABC transporter ATP-binding protein [Sedimentibacter sp.]|uniref:ABC transporter ATP-binding protein n=1 Tax=Sedimentibacter sp. TaxID=1960295 RepID=UPI0029810F98|nr:ABC transporter ATP-binding protein [Sedimentibacter sp.]MDW5299305.1 ABC transporter ATP-binding protein [Sedimentibacter sp.]
MKKHDNLTPVLRGQNIDFNYGKRQVLTDISLDVYEGEYISIIGPNGSGKSTLFNILSGLEKSKHGNVYCENQTLQDMNPRLRAQCIAIVQQNSQQAMPFTCLESILLGVYPYQERFGSISDIQYKKVMQLMKATDTWKLAEQPITQISGGERQRVSLCRALVQEPRVLLLDEAMSEMDISVCSQMSELLKKLCREDGLAVIAIHHDLNLAYGCSNKIYAIKDGRCAGFGTPKEVMTEEMFHHVFNVKVEIFENKGFFIKNKF